MVTAGGKKIEMQDTALLMVQAYRKLKGMNDLFVPVTETTRVL